MPITEQQAIERIEAAVVRAMDYACPTPHGIAQAVALESNVLPAGWTAGIDGPESQRPNPR